MQRPFFMIALNLLVAIVVGTVAYFLDGYWQAALIGTSTVFLTIAASEILASYRDRLERPIFYVTLLTLGIAVLIGTTLYLAFTLVSLTKVQPYPTDGIIADFFSGTGGYARTSRNTQCAMISDSALNLDSRIGYKRIDVGPTGKGFLRVSFELKSQTDATPYVGIYCSFSHFPEIPFDVSKFKNLDFNMRVAPNAPISVQVALYSRRPLGLSESYVFPSYQIPQEDLSLQWKPYFIPFYEFRAAKFTKTNISFDPEAAYRVAFLIFGRPRSDTTAFIDLADIRFAAE